MKIDRDRLLNEMLILRGMTSDLQRPSNFINSYEEYLGFKDVFEIITEEYVEECRLSANYQKIQRYDDLSYKKKNNIFFNKIEPFYDDIITMYKKYTALMRESGFIDFGINKDLKKYSEKDFIDIILSFFAGYGNQYYKLVKRYFDEERIEVGKGFEEYNAFFTLSSLMSSGYILSCDKEYNILNASIISHELGHMIDAETFIFKQRKKSDVILDTLGEVPSIYFEAAFLQYALENRIDVYGSLCSLNSLYASLYDNLISIYENVCVSKEKEFSELKDDDECLRSFIIYGLGGYIGINMVEMDIADRNNFMKKFNNFITSRFNCSLKDSIDILGINYDEFLSGNLIKKRVKENTTRLNNIYNIK